MSFETLTEWKRLREERPCKTCKGSCHIASTNMWGVEPCPDCGYWNGVQKSKYPGVAP